MSPLDFLTRPNQQSAEHFMTREEQGPKNAAENWDQRYQPDEEIRASDQAAKEGVPQPQAQYEKRDVKAEAEHGVEQVKSKVSGAAHKADTALMNALGRDGEEKPGLQEDKHKVEAADSGVGVESEKVKTTVGDALTSAKEAITNAFSGGGKEQESRPTRDEQGPKNAAENWDQRHQPDEEIRAADQAAKEGKPQPQAQYEKRDVKAEAEHGVEQVKSKVSNAVEKADTAMMKALGHDGVEDPGLQEDKHKVEADDSGVGVESEKVKTTVGDALASAKETITSYFSGGGKEQEEEKREDKGDDGGNVEKVKSDIKTTATDAGEAAREGARRAADLAQQNAETARESVKETTGTALKNAREDAQKAADLAQKKADAARESTKDATNAAMEKAQQEAERAAEQAQQKADAAQKSAEENSKSAMETASEYSQQLKENITEMYQGAKETVMGGGNTATDDNKAGAEENKGAEQQKK